MQPSAIVDVEDEVKTVSCDGGGGALGHPRVYLHFAGKDTVDCYYCSRRFAKPARGADTTPR